MICIIVELHFVARSAHKVNPSVMCFVPSFTGFDEIEQCVQGTFLIGSKKENR